MNEKWWVSIMKKKIKYVSNQVKWVGIKGTIITWLVVYGDGVDPWWISWDKTPSQYTTHFYPCNPA